MGKFLRRFGSIILSALMLFACVPGVFAVTTNGEQENDFTPGVVLVDLKLGAPSFEELLPGFEIAEARLITPGSKTQNVYEIMFVAKTKAIVWEAIEVLSQSPYVYTCNPDYIGQYLPVPDTTNPVTTTPVVTQPDATEPVTIGEPLDAFTPGVVLVDLKLGAPSFEELLPGFEIAEARLITPGSKTQNVYEIIFVAKTKEIVWEAIEVLSQSPYVYTCNPDYIGQYLPIPDATTPVTTTPVTTTPVVTQPDATEPVTIGEPLDAFTPGVVLVDLKLGAPSFEELLPGFEIAEARLITPGSKTQNVYEIIFVTKTKEIVWEAIEVLSQSPYVYTCNPDYIGQYLPVTEPTDSEPTEPETEEPNDDLPGYVKGDANNDGYLSMKDVTYIQRYLAGFISDQDINLSAANVTGSGAVSIRDTTMIQQKLAGYAVAW